MAALRPRITPSFRSCLVLVGVVAMSFGATAPAAPQGRELAERVKAQDWNAARALIKQGADVNASLPDGATPLHWAARAGQKEAVELLLKHKADINAKDRLSQTPLHLAVEKQQLKVARSLLAHKANVNARAKSEVVATGISATVL